MKGDFTRNTFDPLNNFSRVLMQQGRVQLDADVNEQVSILLRYMRLLARDVIGLPGGPEGACGFEIVTTDTFKDLGEKEKKDKWDAIEPDSMLREPLEKAVNEENAVIGPGRYYVDGVLVENHRAILYTEQPGYEEFDPSIRIEALQDLKEQGVPFLAYLDVWERHITHINDDQIREVALGGPDTCSRAQVVWQVKVLHMKDIQNFEVKTAKAKADDAVNMLPPLGTGRLRARARFDQLQTDPCVASSEARYRGTENQLYRVEVHRGGKAATGNEEGDKDCATFKWSRDNGSVVFPIRSLTGNTALLEHLGRDVRFSLNPGDWVEIVDESIAMSGNVGSLAQVNAVDRDELTVTLTERDDLFLKNYTEADVMAKHPLLRRWDHSGDPTFFGALAINGQDDIDEGWIALENGVWVRFEGDDAEYRAGDYWLIPARVATGDIEWTTELDKDGNAIGVALEAEGPRHNYAPLFLYLHKQQNNDGPTEPNDQPNIIDCRCTMAPLCGQGGS
ncbi:hypothetical protein Dvar_22590 [Desulfosarcina variabilis str. Montpellier]|uniref:DUF6519 domain-containing protein n=1 Tax=Desulfosarcina variabilis TaxID=2300 RepID=UPI003AFB75AE